MNIGTGEITTKIVSTNIKVVSGPAADYNSLYNKPLINGNILQGGENTSASLGIVEDKTFVFEQKISSDLWEINHNLNKFPSVTIVDSAGSTVLGDVIYIDINNLNIIFSAPFTGVVYLN